MDLAALALLLAQAAEQDRLRLLQGRPVGSDVALAHALKGLFDEAKTSNPRQASGASASLQALSQIVNELEIRGLAAWTAGMAALQLAGTVDQAITYLDEAAACFTSVSQAKLAAATQISKIYALAVLGRYEEAITCALRVRDEFVTYGDIALAGKVEHNLGNIYARRDQYQEAEHFYRLACDRFARVNDLGQLALVETCLANILSSQHRFRPASALYEQALARVETSGLTVTVADIECNLGCLALFQGQYDRALDFLERSRRRYAALGMADRSALLELNLADAYLELNLAPEAIAIYERIIPRFAELGMRAEQAWAQSHQARVFLAQGDRLAAGTALRLARELYKAEGNAVGESSVTLTEAQLRYAENDFATAIAFAAEVDAPLEKAGAWGPLLLARWLRGEAARAQGDVNIASTSLVAVLQAAEAQAVPQVAQRCHTSLGLLAAQSGNLAEAKAEYLRALEIIETLRAPLPAEDFRVAFITDKLTPYTELARLCLGEGTPTATREALLFLERGRSRALMDMLHGALPVQPTPKSAFEAGLWSQLLELREDLNWFYSQMNRQAEAETDPNSGATVALQDHVRALETAVSAHTLQLQQTGMGALISVESLNLERLQRHLGTDTMLVEYFSIDGVVRAFVVTEDQVTVTDDLATEAQIESLVGQLRFQVDALRFGVERMRTHLPQLAARTVHYLKALYVLLLEPIKLTLAEHRIVIVPNRTLHYVPFHALHDGKAYLIEQQEVCYAPSAGILDLCLEKPRSSIESVMLFGVADAEIPRVHDEVATIARLFGDARTFLDKEATVAALFAQAPDADVLHLACHGQFRPDNPLFSSLQLADGRITVRDAYRLNLQCELVTLSACETGVTDIRPGEELIGLARGFFSAGAPSILLSLWTVDDACTAALMADFYARLRAGDQPATALRFAQRRALTVNPHPFFWSAFTLVGRW